MSAPAEPRKRLKVDVPSEAAHWSVYRVTIKPGGNHSRSRMKGSPGEDGAVPDAWPVGEFSTQRVLEVWGEGKYRVEWYDAAGERIPPGQMFEVAKPEPKKGRKLTPNRRPAAIAEGDDDEPIAAATARASAGGGIGVLELMTLLRGEREDARELAERQAERDRQFWMQMQAQQTQLLTTVLGKTGGAGDGELLRREMRLTVNEGLLTLERKFGQFAQPPDDDDPDDDPDDPPKDLGEAGERIGLALLGEIERGAPQLLQEMMPTLVKFLQGKGFQPSPELQERIAHAQRNGHANGG